MQPANLRSEAADHGSSKMAASNIGLILFRVESGKHPVFCSTSPQQWGKM